MAPSVGHLADRVGILKILTIVLGIVTLGLTAYSYYHDDGRDKAFLACTIICFILSFFWALTIVLGGIDISDFQKKIELVVHCLAFLFYLITLICFTVSLIDHRTGKNTTNHRLGQRIFAFIFGVATTLVYGYLSWLLYHALGVVQ